MAVFWFAARDKDLPYEEGRAYAQTSRIEIGKVLGWKDYEPQIKVAVGFEPTYTSLGGGSERYIRDECRLYSMPVHDSLEAMQLHVEDLLS